MEREIIFTSAAPAPAGAYSQAIKCGNTIYVSGQIPVDMSTGTVQTEDTGKAARLILTNIDRILGAAGYSMINVVKFTVYLKEITDVKFVDEALKEVYGDIPCPARATIQAAALPKACRVEIDAIAVM